MKTRLITTAIFSIIFLFQIETQAGFRSRAKRSFQGVKSGEVTRGEARRISRGERRLQRTRRQARKDDGQIDRQERREIHKQKRQQNRRIYRSKHNKRDRN